MSSLLYSQMTSLDSWIDFNMPSSAVQILSAILAVMEMKLVTTTFSFSLSFIYLMVAMMESKCK
jgi:hypothetical protein